MGAVCVRKLIEYCVVCGMGSRVDDQKKIQAKDKYRQKRIQAKEERMRKKIQVTNRE